MVEASMVLPIAILAVMLLIRLFTFYLEILNTSIKAHEKLLEKWDSYNGKTIEMYLTEDHVGMIKGGLLDKNMDKKIETRAYLINEDAMVRISAAIK